MGRRPTETDPRLAALEILERVESGGAYADRLLDVREARFADRRDARLLRELVLGTLRRRRWLDAWLEEHLRDGVQRLEPVVAQALRLGAYGVLFMDRVPDFASVDTAVEAVKRRGRGRAAGLVNAVLRRLVGRKRRPPRIEGDAAHRLSVIHSYPEWWVRRLLDRFGEAATVAWLEEGNRPAPTVLRPAPGEDAEALAAALAREGVETEPGRFAPGSLRVLSGSAPATRAMQQGRALAQDEASQLVCRLFGDGSFSRIADLCAAPGTKTRQLIERLEPAGLLLATDRHPARLARLQAALSPAERSRVVCAVADQSRAGAVRGPFDAILVDAPCSGTGTLRRHPEIRWRLQADDLSRLARLQRAILEHAAALLAPGGRLVYSVCSLEPEEGERQVALLLESHPGLRRADAREALPPQARRLIGSDGSFFSGPPALGLDGFFAAAIVKDR